MFSLQIQSVLYKNPVHEIERSLESIFNAVKNHHDSLSTNKKIIVSYGDASPEPVVTDEILDGFRQKYHDDLTVNYIHFGFNSGHGHGQNLLAESCSTEYILILQPDAILAPNFFDEIIKPFDANPGAVGMVVGRQTPLEHPKEYNVETGETDWGSLACALIPLALFRQVNGIDHETFYMYCDDVDLSWRIRMTGYKIIYQPRAVFFHAKKLSTECQWIPTASEIYYSAEASLLMAYKWSNDDLLKKLIDNYESSQNENQVKAVEEFYRRQKAGSLPEKIAVNQKSPQFYEYDYNLNRFVL